MEGLVYLVAQSSHSYLSYSEWNWNHFGALPFQSCIRGPKLCDFAYLEHLCRLLTHNQFISAPGAIRAEAIGVFVLWQTDTLIILVFLKAEFAS